MIQLFLTILLLVILAIIINTKEPFYQKSCTTNKLYAINATVVTNMTKIPCIKLITENDIKGKSGYIVINEKNVNTSTIINLTDDIINKDDENGKNYIDLTEIDKVSNIELGKTYIITLNIIYTSNVVVYNTVEITFRKVNLSGDDLNTKCKTTKDKLIDSLKTKNIVFHL